MSQAFQIPLSDCVMAVDLPEAYELEERITRETMSEMQAILRKDLTNARAANERKIAYYHRMWELHWKRTCYDIGYRSGVTDMKKEAPELNAWFSHMAKSGQGLTVVQLQVMQGGEQRNDG